MTATQTTLSILGRDGGDTCGQSDCGEPGCTRPAHMVRTVLLRLAHGEGEAQEVVDGSAMMCRDEINGGWMPMGDSVDCWLGSDLVDAARRLGVLPQVIEHAQDWQVRSVRIGG